MSYFRSTCDGVLQNDNSNNVYVGSIYIYIMHAPVTALDLDSRDLHTRVIELCCLQLP